MKNTKLLWAMPARAAVLSFVMMTAGCASLDELLTAFLSEPADSGSPSAGTTSSPQSAASTLAPTAPATPKPAAAASAPAGKIYTGPLTWTYAPVKNDSADSHASGIAYGNGTFAAVDGLHGFNVKTPAYRPAFTTKGYENSVISNGRIYYSTDGGVSWMRVNEEDDATLRSAGAATTKG